MSPRRKYDDPLPALVEERATARRLRKQVRELLADKARLDWMTEDAKASRRGHGPYHSLTFASDEWSIYRHSGDVLATLYRGPSLRDAIDAAMRPTPDVAPFTSSLHTPSSPKEME